MKEQIVIASICFIFAGCLDQGYDTFTIDNQTNKKLTIEGYAVKWSEKINRETVYKETFEVPANSKYSIPKGKGEESDPSGIFTDANIIDSVNIFFESERVIKFVCFEQFHDCSETRNILNYQEFFTKTCEDKSCTYVYTITNADFETAEPIK